MGWSVGEFNGRDIGYGVPAICDHPGCGVEIDRGLSYVCGNDVYGGEFGCGLFFCDKHRGGLRSLCDRCLMKKEPFDPTPDVAEWLHHKATDPSWAAWRLEQEL